IRRRPSRSAARPPSSRKPPKTSAYALITHWRFSCENPRSTLIEGNATFTIAMSRTTMNWTTLRSASASHLRRSVATMCRLVPFVFVGKACNLTDNACRLQVFPSQQQADLLHFRAMVKRYDAYCPVAHALAVVGEKWALLVVLELVHGPKRYTDLVEHLPGIGTNILASRLRDLEAAGVVAKRKLPPPAASQVYELTEYGRGLRAALRELALWGARSLGPPRREDLFPGWLVNPLDVVLSPGAPAGRFEFHVDDEVASLVDGQVQPGPVEDPDVIV